MLYNGFDSYIMEEHEPVLRSCWECNEAHQHLKDVSSLHYCFWCGRYWIFGQYLDSFETLEALDEFLRVRLTPVRADAEHGTELGDDQSAPLNLAVRRKSYGL